MAKFNELVSKVIVHKDTKADQLQNVLLWVTKNTGLEVLHKVEKHPVKLKVTKKWDIDHLYLIGLRNNL